MLENRKVGIVLIFMFCVCFANCFILRTRETEFPVRSIITIRTLQQQYASKHQGKFALNFDELIKTVTLDERFGGETPVINGYVFEMKVVESTENQPSFYSIKAYPIDKKGKTTRSYYFDSSLGTIKYSEEGEADAQSPSI